MKCSSLLARKPNPRALHPFALRLTRDRQFMMFGKHLECQRRAEIRVLLFHQCDGEIPNRRINPVVRRSTTRLVPDRRRTIGAKILEQKLGLPSTQAQCLPLS